VSAVALWLLLDVPAQAAPSPLALPSPGAPPVVTGRLDYRVSWNGISAANATVNIARVDAGAAPLYRVEASVQTSWLVDWLWSLRARVFASFTTSDLTPLSFRYDRDMNREHSLTDIYYDPSTLHPTGFLTRRGRTTTLSVDTMDVLDPITAVFRALSQPIHVGDTFRYEVFTGEASYRVVLEVLGEDVITVAAGTFKAWRVEPQVWKVGVGACIDHRLRHATMWVSQSPVRAVVRIRSEVFIGAVNCDLQHLDGPAGGVSSMARSPLRTGLVASSLSDLAVLSDQRERSIEKMPTAGPRGAGEPDRRLVERDGSFMPGLPPLYSKRQR